MDYARQTLRLLINGLRDVNARLERIETTIHNQSRHIMSTLSDLEAAVARETSIAASAVVLIQGIHKQLVDAGMDETKIAALKAQLDASAAALSAAVEANTAPGAPVAPAPHAVDPAPAPHVEPPVDPKPV